MHFSFVEFTKVEVQDTPKIPTIQEQLKEADKMLQDPDCYWQPIQSGEDIVYMLQCPYNHHPVPNNEQDPSYEGKFA